MIVKIEKHRSSWVVGIMTILIFLFIGFSSCKKDGETKAVITVMNDSTGKAEPNVTVNLWQDTTVNTTTGAKSNVNVTKITDSEGRAEFVFALEAYLNIKATKGTKTANGFVRLKEHETVSQTVHF